MKTKVAYKIGLDKFGNISIWPYTI